METIKNYLESMFRNLPQTEKVLRAKSELLQMMEDKYTELIRQGKSENEAVGTVISDFGNLEELSADLGIADIYASTKTGNANKRVLTFDEVKGYISSKIKSGSLVATGVLLCICASIGPILADICNFSETLGVIALFIMIGIAIVLFIFSGTNMEDYKFLKTESCTLDSVSRDYVNTKRKEYLSNYSIKQSVGILLIVLSVLPPIILDNHGKLEDLSAAFLLAIVSIGVYLLITANTTKNAYQNLLNIDSFSGSEKEPVYRNKTVKTIMAVYWPTITCIYLCYSIISANWHISWLIWPIAAVGQVLIRSIFAEDLQ